MGYVAFLLYVGPRELFHSRWIVHDTRAADSDSSIPHVFDVRMVVVKSIAHSHFRVDLPTLLKNETKNKNIITDLELLLKSKEYLINVYDNFWYKW